MAQAFQAVGQALSYFLAAAMVWGLLFWVARSNAQMWSRVAARYSGRSRTPLLGRKRPVTIVVAERDPENRTLLARLSFRQYALTSVALHEDGLVLSQVPPFGPFCRPLFLPFEKMELKSTDWMLWSDPTAICMHALPTIDILIDRDLRRWIRARTDAFPFGLGF